MGKSDLPPGTTPRDFYTAVGVIRICDSCGRDFLAASVSDDETQCPKCRDADDAPGGADFDE